MTTDPTPRAAAPAPQTSTVDRAFAIVGSFSRTRVRQSLSDISRRTGLPLATTHRIVQRLIAWGALQRGEDGKYGIGLRLWEAASHAPHSVGLQRTARPFMLDILRSTGYSSHLAVREGHELLMLERYERPGLDIPTPSAGGRYALHTSALGQVLLAFGPDDLRREILDGPLLAQTTRSYTDAAVLERVLVDVRRAGYAVSDRQADTLHVGVAAPIFDSEGEVVAALSVALTERDVDGSSVINLVRVTATSISRAMGYQGAAST